MWKACVLIGFMLSAMVHSSLSLTRCKKHELDALVKFKHSFSQDQHVLSSWVGDDCCNWLGVTCDNVTSNVIKLVRRSASLDIDDGSLKSSELSPALLELKFLRHLDLSGNNFSWSRIPGFIGSMINLRYLNLSDAKFWGQIPHQLGNLTNLIHLDLNNGPLEDMWLHTNDGLEWASRLSKLQSLDMSGIDLSQANIAIESLIRLPSLSVLRLAYCNLSNTHLTTKVRITNTSDTPSSTLQYLDLGNNNFESAFPSFLRNMTSFRHLYLDYNSFSGSVPLKNMKRLEVLDLRYNGFTYVEGGIWGIIENSCNLKYLDLSKNLISQGEILEAFTNSSRCDAYDLEHLDLGFNKLNGNLSWLGQLTKLNFLDLSNNGFQGPIPASLSKLSALTCFILPQNRLSGLMPDVLGHLTQLVSIDISSNSLQGIVSGIGNLSNLEYLDLSSNNNLHLNLSSDWRPPILLRFFIVRSCKINTVFPRWVSNLTDVVSLDLSNTSLSGELPEWLWNVTNIGWLLLRDNQLTGSLPRGPRDMACKGCSLAILDLCNNMISGTIPQWLGHLGTLGVLDLSGNLLSGGIFEGENESSLFTSSSLDLIDLSDNMLSGEIQIKNVYPDSKIEIFSLRGNDFSGHISSQFCLFPHLMILELAHNRLSGHIPRCLGSLPFIGNQFEWNADSGVETQEIIKGVDETFDGTGGIHSFIDLSSNRLVGAIPEELTNISTLMQLNLSNNHLIGRIPEDIGKLKSLESLDLSNNNISGTIPQSLSDISWLSFLNLSNNNLQGPIPAGNQLQTLDDPSIYAGNSGLCGFPLPNKCTKQPSPTNMHPTAGKEDEAEDKHEKMWLYLVIMSGVATGFWGVVGTLVLKKSWRHAYFRFVEETGDRIYVPIKVRLNRFRNNLG